MSGKRMASMSLFRKPKPQNSVIEHVGRSRLNPAQSLGNLKDLGNALPETATAEVATTPRHEQLYQQHLAWSTKAVSTEALNILAASSLDEIPESIRDHIFSFLDSRDLCRSMRVSRSWYKQILVSQRLWKERIESDFVANPRFAGGFPLNELERYSILRCAHFAYIAMGSNRRASHSITSNPSSPSASSKIRIACMGDVGLGKTWLTNQFALGTAPETYEPTIEDSYSRDVVIDGVPHKVEVVDTGGDSKLLADYADKWVRAADGFVVVYDQFSEQSAQRLNNWIQLIQSIKGRSDIPIVIAANDLKRHGPGAVVINKDQATRNNDNEEEDTAITPSPPHMPPPDLVVQEQQQQLNAEEESKATPGVVFHRTLCRASSVGRSIAMKHGKCWLPLTFPGCHTAVDNVRITDVFTCVVRLVIAREGGV